MTSFFSLQFEMGTAREQVVRSKGGLYLSRKAVEGPAWFLWFGVEARELDDPVQAALVAVRSLGELSVLLG